MRPGEKRSREADEEHEERSPFLVTATHGIHGIHKLPKKDLLVARDGGSSPKTGSISGGISGTGISRAQDSLQTQMPPTPHLRLGFIPGSWSLTLETKS